MTLGADTQGDLLVHARSELPAWWDGWSFRREEAAMSEWHTEWVAENRPCVQSLAGRLAVSQDELGAWGLCRSLWRSGGLIQ